MENQENAFNTNQSNQPNQSFNSPFTTPELPNATAVLVLGIISIVGCFCYGIVGLILGIVALVISSRANALLIQNPTGYSASSVKNYKAGRICAIIGTCLSATYIIVIIIWIAFWGTFFMSLPWGDMMKGAH